MESAGAPFPQSARAYAFSGLFEIAALSLKVGFFYVPPFRGDWTIEKACEAPNDSTPER